MLIPSALNCYAYEQYYNNPLYVKQMDNKIMFVAETVVHFLGYQKKINKLREHKNIALNE